MFKTLNQERKKEYLFFFHNAHTCRGNWLYSMYMNVGCLYVALRKVSTSTPCETFVRHTEGGCLSCLMLMLCAGRKVTGYGRRPCFNPETWWVLCFSVNYWLISLLLSRITGKRKLYSICANNVIIPFTVKFTVLFCALYIFLARFGSNMINNSSLLSYTLQFKYD